MADQVYQKPLDQRGLKTLILWLVWACISGAVFVQLYHQADIWSYVLHDPSGITRVLLGGFAIGLLVSFTHVVMLTLEWFRALRIETTMQDRGLHGLSVKSPRKAVDRFTQAIKHIVATGGTVKLAELVEVEFAAHYRQVKFVSLMGNLLITLGLIGTVLGLTMTLTGLNGALESVGEDRMAMLIGLRDAMSGMGLAFYTTLLGAVMGGVLLRVFAHITDNSTEALQAILVRSCLVYAAAELKENAGEINQLDHEVGRLEQRLSGLQLALRENQLALRDFAADARDAREAMMLTGPDDEIFKSIAVHRHYAKVLRYELSLQRQLANFRQRLLRALGFHGKASS